MILTDTVTVTAEASASHAQWHSDSAAASLLDCLVLWFKLHCARIKTSGSIAVVQ